MKGVNLNFGIKIGECGLSVSSALKLARNILKMKSVVSIHSFLMSTIL